MTRHVGYALKAGRWFPVEYCEDLDRYVIRIRAGLGIMMTFTTWALRIAQGEGRTE